MIPAYEQPIIDLGLFEQNGGWVFIGVKHGHGFYCTPLFSGKRRNLSEAIQSAKKLVPPGHCVVYSRLDNTFE
jgi:hypothetical protein